MDDQERELGTVSDRGLEWAEAFLHEYRQRVGESFELEWALETVGAVREVTRGQRYVQRMPADLPLAAHA